MQPRLPDWGCDQRAVPGREGEQAGALSAVPGSVFQDAGRPAKPREDPLEDYQEDQEQEIVRHQGSSSFPLCCGVTWVCWQPGAGEGSAFRDSRSAPACSVRSPEQAWSPLLPFPGVQSTLCALCPLLLSGCIHLQQLSWGKEPQDESQKELQEKSQAVAVQQGQINVFLQS